MGITGLLPYMAPATRPCHVSEFRGGTVAVDSYCLLHRGANACAVQLARGEHSRIYIDYCLKYVKMLLSYDIHPIMVFDGRNLPAKAETEAKRRENRKRAKIKAVELMKLGKLEEAKTYFKQCVDITPKMAHNLIHECHKLNVDCIVAPYESDAQLAFFNMNGVAECVITEDSDLMLFGCSKVLYKLDLTGQGQLVEANKLNLAMKMRPDQFSFDRFRFMCILSGCDYVSSLTGIGLKKAEKFLKLTTETSPEIFIEKIPRYLKMHHLTVNKEYKINVLIANATFLHQIVFDPYKGQLVHLTDPESAGTDPTYLINVGEKFDSDKALQVAMGNLNPYNFEEFDKWEPKPDRFSIWSGVCCKRISSKLQKEMQKTKLEQYFIKQDASDKIQQTKQKELEEFVVENDLAKYAVATKQVIEANVEEVKEEKLSPIAYKHNPFLQKKISKIPQTVLSSTSVVTSRFFSPQGTIYQQKIIPEVIINSDEDVKEKQQSDEVVESQEQTETNTQTVEEFDIENQELKQSLEPDTKKFKLTKENKISASQEVKRSETRKKKSKFVKTGQQRTMLSFFNKLH